MNRTWIGRCAAAGAAVVCLSATVLAGVGDLEYAKSPPARRGVYVRFAAPEKLDDAAAMGLKGPAVVADGTAKELKISAAVIRSTGEGDFDTLLLDLTGKRDFAHAAKVPVKTDRKTSTLYLTTVGPGKAVAERNGQKVPVTVTGRYYEMKGQPRLYLSLTAAVQGQCAFGEAVRTVRIIDASGNLGFDDAHDPAGGSRAPADLVEMADEKGRFTAGAASAGMSTLLGQPLQVGTKWFVLKVEGMKVRSEPLDCPMGKISGCEGPWQMSLTGKKYRILVGGTGKGEVPVPADTYRISRCMYLNPDGSGQGATAVLSYTRKSVTVAENAIAAVPIGLPVKATMTARVAGRRVTFNVNRLDAAGNRILGVMKADGTQPPAPSIDVVDKTGKVVYTAKLEYG